MTIHTIKVVHFSEIAPNIESFTDDLSEQLNYCWGTNNRSLIKVSRFFIDMKKYFDVSNYSTKEKKLFQEFLLTLKEVEEEADYIDLEN